MIETFRNELSRVQGARRDQGEPLGFNQGEARLFFLKSFVNGCENVSERNRYSLEVIANVNVIGSVTSSLDLVRVTKSLRNDLLKNIEKVSLDDYDYRRFALSVANQLVIDTYIDQFSRELPKFNSNAVYEIEEILSPINSNLDWETHDRVIALIDRDIKGFESSAEVLKDMLALLTLSNVGPRFESTWEDSDYSRILEVITDPEVAWGSFDKGYSLPFGGISIGRMYSQSAQGKKRNWSLPDIVNGIFMDLEGDVMITEKGHANNANLSFDTFTRYYSAGMYATLKRLNILSHGLQPDFLAFLDPFPRNNREVGRDERDNRVQVDTISSSIIPFELPAESWGIFSEELNTYVSIVFDALDKDLDKSNLPLKVLLVSGEYGLQPDSKKNSGDAADLFRYYTKYVLVVGGIPFVLNRNHKVKDLSTAKSILSPQEQLDQAYECAINYPNGM